MNKILLIIGGIINFLLVLFHLSFWKIFNWSESLSCLNFMDRAVMQTLNVHIAFVVLFFSVVSIFYFKELLSTGLGKLILISISGFYFLRSLNQIIFFDITDITSIVIFMGGIIIGLIYLIPFFTSKKTVSNE